MTKNVVRNSNQRCIVVHGTHNANVIDNVAYQAFAHCFIVEDGIETGNTFERNLGAGVLPPEIVIPGRNDNEVSVFWITNANNTW